MKKEKKLIGLLLIMGIMLIGCSGDDDVEKDKIPPTKTYSNSSSWRCR